MLLESVKTEGVLTSLKYQKPGDEQRAAPSFRRVQCYVWRGCIVATPVTRNKFFRGQTLGTIRTPTLRAVSRGEVPTLICHHVDLRVL